MVGNEEIKDDKISQESVEITNSKRKSKKQLPNTGMKDSIRFCSVSKLRIGLYEKISKKIKRGFIK